MKPEKDNAFTSNYRALTQEPEKRLPTKKDQIIELWKSGQRDLRLIAHDLDTKPSYVASVLQTSGLIHGYYDLYTSPEDPMNIYSEDFKGKLGFKDIPTAQRSVGQIDKLYSEFDELRDRAGQHHCLATALAMYNRARFIGKLAEANVYFSWLLNRLMESQNISEKDGNTH